MKLADALAIVREADVPVPSAAHRDEIRAAVLAAAATMRPAAPTVTTTRPVASTSASADGARVRRRVRLAAIASVAAIVAVVVGLMVTRGSGDAAQATHRGSVATVGSGATFTTTALPDEIVRLTEGTIAVTVAPLRPGERFRVIAGDGEVEVRGTAFEVEAHGDHLARVRVDHGRVEVRPRGGAMRVLGADEQWVSSEVARADVDEHHGALGVVAPGVVAPAVVASGVVAPGAITPAGSGTSVTSIAQATRAATVAPATRPATPAPAIVRTPHAPVAPIAARGPDAIAFDEAWDAMRAEQFAPAAIAFARVVAIEPAGPLADDARFWSAVAHSRAKHARIAIEAFREVVDQHAGSAHAAEAAAMLGWLLLEISPRTPAITAEARDRFTTALGATSPRVRASAQTGLDQLDKS